MIKFIKQLAKPVRRGGKNLVETEACDHDFSHAAKLTHTWYFAARVR